MSFFHRTIGEINSGMEEWLPTDPVESPAWLAAYVNSTSTRAGTWIGGARAGQIFDNTKRLGDLKVPTLVIWGTQDSICSVILHHRVETVNRNPHSAGQRAQPGLKGRGWSSGHLTVSDCRCNNRPSMDCAYSSIPCLTPRLRGFGLSTEIIAGEQSGL